MTTVVTTGTGKRKRYYKKKGKPLAKNTVKQVKKIVENVLKKNTEYKQHSDGYSLAVVYGATAGASISHLTNITQAITDTGRIGDEITLKSIQIRGVIYNNTGAASNPYNFIRVIVFQYKSADNIPTVDEYLQNSVVSGNTRSAFSARNQDYMGIYISLFDKVYKVEGGAANAANYGPTGNISQYIQFNVPLKYCTKKIQYEAATTLATNGIYLIVIGSSASVTNNPTQAFQWTVLYTDS